MRADGALELHLALGAGTHHDLVLEISDHALPRVPVRAREAWQATGASWAAAVPEPGAEPGRRRTAGTATRCWPG